MSDHVETEDRALVDDATSKQSYDEQEEAIKKKYGGILPKKVPLVTKDHERAYFDSADWALGKIPSSLKIVVKTQGAPVEKPKGPLEAPRPKLQPTPNHQVRSRRSSYANMEGEDGGNSAPDDTNSSHPSRSPVLAIAFTIW